MIHAFILFVAKHETTFYFLLSRRSVDASTRHMAPFLSSVPGVLCGALSSRQAFTNRVPTFHPVPSLHLPLRDGYYYTARSGFLLKRALSNALTLWLHRAFF